MTDQSGFDISWIDGGAEPSHPANLGYPHGIDLDISGDARNRCHVTLPYPAKRIGKYVVRCLSCAVSVICTTAGRVDDPRSITIACRAPWED